MLEELKKIVIKAVREEEDFSLENIMLHIDKEDLNFILSLKIWLIGEKKSGKDTIKITTNFQELYNGEYSPRSIYQHYEVDSFLKKCNSLLEDKGARTDDDGFRRPRDRVSTSRSSSVESDVSSGSINSFRSSPSSSRGNSSHSSPLRRTSSSSSSSHGL